MAHAGKDYPVHFRRDFNLNVTTNNTGIARAYALTSSSAFGTVGRALPGKRFICIAQDETTFDGAKWESEFQLVGGRPVSILIVCDPTEVNKGVVARGELIDSAAGTIGQFGLAQPFDHRYGTITFGWDQHFIPRRDLFEPNIGSTGRVSAVLWPEWNNL